MTEKSVAGGFLCLPRDGTERTLQKSPGSIAPRASTALSERPPAPALNGESPRSERPQRPKVSGRKLSVERGSAAWIRVGS